MRLRLNEGMTERQPYIDRIFKDNPLQSAELGGPPLAGAFGADCVLPGLGHECFRVCNALEETLHLSLAVFLAAVVPNSASCAQQRATQ